MRPSVESSNRGSSLGRFSRLRRLAGALAVRARDEAGQTLVEYVFIGSLIVGIVIIAAFVLDSPLKAFYSSVGNAL